MEPYSRATIVLCVISLLGSSNAAPNPDVKLDVKVNVDGKEVIHATHPKGAEARAIIDIENTGTFDSSTMQKERLHYNTVNYKLGIIQMCIVF